MLVVMPQKENIENQIKEQYFWNFFFSLLFVLFAVGLVWALKWQNKLPLGIPVFDFILLSIAVFRLIRLFVYDLITDFIRDFFKKFERGPFRTISNLLGCSWCTGVWIGLFLSFFYFLTPFAWYPILIFAVSGIGTFIQITANRISRR